MKHRVIPAVIFVALACPLKYSRASDFNGKDSVNLNEDVLEVGGYFNDDKFKVKSGRSYRYYFDTDLFGLNDLHMDGKHNGNTFLDDGNNVGIRNINEDNKHSKNGINRKAFSAFQKENGGLQPRRLDMKETLINLAFQSAVVPELRSALNELKKSVRELLFGEETTELKIGAFYDDKCLMSLDFGRNFYDISVKASSVSFASIPEKKALMLIYSSVPVDVAVRSEQKHLQHFIVPSECMAAGNERYRIYCNNIFGDCKVNRIDIQLTKVDSRQLEYLDTVSPLEFLRFLMEDKKFMFHDAADLIDANTPEGRLMFSEKSCSMHAVVPAEDISKIKISFNPSEHSFRIDAKQNTDSFIEYVPEEKKWLRKKVILPWGCGGAKKEDFIATLLRNEDGKYKIVIIGPTALTLNRPDQIFELNKADEYRPIADYEPSSVTDLVDIFPDNDLVPIKDMKPVSYV